MKIDPETEISKIIDEQEKIRQRYFDVLVYN